MKSSIAQVLPLLHSRLDEKALLHDCAREGCKQNDCVLFCAGTEPQESADDKKWRDLAGRTQGKEGYVFGDLTRSLVHSVFGTRAESSATLQDDCSAQRTISRAWVMMNGLDWFDTGLIESVLTQQDGLYQVLFHRTFCQTSPSPQHRTPSNILGTFPPNLPLEHSTRHPIEHSFKHSLRHSAIISNCIE